MDWQIYVKMMFIVCLVVMGYDFFGFGMWIDLFMGWCMQYDGVDFVGFVGMFIVVVVGGVVVVSEFYYEYGNMIDIDYGNGLKMCYVYVFKVFVKVGDIVKVGECIVLIGCIGCVIGLYLYFEVYVNDVLQNLVVFLENVG